MTTHASADALSTPSLGQTVTEIAAVVAHEGFPTGDRAALKRLNPSGSPNVAFYRFAFRHLPDGWERSQQGWMALVAGVALMCPRPHRADRPAGMALAEVGYAEARVERLLAAEGDTLRTLLLRAARFLAAKSASVNWTDFARLLLAVDPSKREAARLRVARDYYRNLKD